MYIKHHANVATQTGQVKRSIRRRCGYWTPRTPFPAYQLKVAQALPAAAVHYLTPRHLPLLELIQNITSYGKHENV
jgi:hypothetical protein